ncbi:hypothetical protein [Hyalangium minutum]|uniref:Lipoprotein n=1 Tax=Hyalangium minutum TaxID=394096 RepID=A0A085WLA1_9BACT|nr:hypothetical protein [Hyalangium minutum]KFE68464.1 hypothetical protein DB31_7701 [Hyalangium minutum]
MMKISLVTLARGAVFLWLLFWATTSFAQADASGVDWRPGALSAPTAPPATDAPLSTGAWVAHGTLTLVPLGGLYAASRLGNERAWAAGAQTGAGMAAAWVPSGLLFFRAQSAGPRWAEWEVSLFGLGMVATPTLAGLGTWTMGEWAFHGSQHRERALLGALGGATVGTLLGVATYEVLERLAAPGSRMNAWRRGIALGFVGSGATAGYQWAGGGPRDRIRR